MLLCCYAYFEEHLNVGTGMEVEDSFDTDEGIHLFEKCFGR